MTFHAQHFDTTFIEIREVSKVTKFLQRMYGNFRPFVRPTRPISQNTSTKFNQHVALGALYRKRVVIGQTIFFHKVTIYTIGIPKALRNLCCFSSACVDLFMLIFSS